MSDRPQKNIPNEPIESKTKIYAKHVGPSAVATILGHGFETADELRTRLETGKAIVTTDAMQYGIDHEKAALKVYVRYTGTPVYQAHFAKDKHCPRFGGRADGLVWPERQGQPNRMERPIGGVEIKCTKKSPTVYFNHELQAISYMYLYGTSWWDIVVYNPETNEAVMHRLHWSSFYDKWAGDWYPRIKDFISSVHWA